MGVPRIEVLPPNELPAASPPNTDRSGRGRNGQFLPGNRIARAGLVRPGPKGGTEAFGVIEGFAPFRRWGVRYAAHRRAELARLHGGELSAGAAAMIESAGAQLAGSRYLQARAAETGDPALFRQASTLANDARQNELAAWELASREAKARPSSSTGWGFNLPETKP